MKKISFKYTILLFLLLVECETVQLDLDNGGFYIASNEDDILDNIIVKPVILSEEFGGTKRKKRDVEDDGDLRSKIFSTKTKTLQIQDWILILDNNENLIIHDDYEETWISNDTFSNNVESSGCKYYTGSVLYETESKAVITICGDYYYGFFTTGNRSFFIEPTNKPSNGHIVYKAKLPQPENGPKREKRCSMCIMDSPDLTGDTFSSEIDYDFSEEDENIHTNSVNKSSSLDDYDDDYEEIHNHRAIHWRKSEDDDLGYFVDTAWITRPLKSELK